MSRVLSSAVSPAWDSGFAQSNTHGEAQQVTLLRATVALCTQRRTAVDVGAHIGLWTRNLAPLFKYVLAVEPVPENFACLAANVGAPNIGIVNAALGAMKQECRMNLPKQHNSGCWHVAPGGDTKMLTLDSFNLGDVDLIKLDVEGYEGAVIRGAYETIRACKPVICFEDNGTGPRYFGEQWDNPKSILASLGYTRRLRLRKDEIWTPA